MNKHEPYKEETYGRKRITTFNIEEPKETIKATPLKKERICLRCNKVFEPNSKNQDYCSKECWRKNWNENMRKKQAEDRQEEKMFLKLSKLSKEQIDKFNELMERQQFIEDMPMIEKNTCYICGARENLIEHHIRYIPEEKIILCKSCHIFLHMSLLKGRKCKPNPNQ